MGRISCGLSRVISRPSNMILPDFGSISLMMVRAVVDFPHPDSPTRLNTSPCLHIKADIVDRMDHPIFQ